MRLTLNWLNQRKQIHIYLEEDSLMKDRKEFAKWRQWGTPNPINEKQQNTYQEDKKKLTENINK